MRTVTKEIDTGPATAVRAWREADGRAWDAYVSSHPRATLFHLTAWKRVLERTFGYPARYLVAERGDRLCGVLPLFVCRSIRGTRALYSLPHTVYGGPLGDDAPAEAALLAAAREIGADVRAKKLELRNRYPTTLDLPRIDGFVTFEKELPDEPAEVYRTLPKKAREAVNQARKRHRLEAGFEDDFETFYGLVAASYHRLGTPVFPRRFFEAMRDEFAERCSILTVRHEGRAVSTVLSLEFRDTVFPLYSGEEDGVRNLKSNNFKYFRLMELAVERGLKRFDFGRSRLGNEGAVRFKANQGFEMEVLPYQVDAPAEEAGGDPDPNRGVFRRVRKVWTRLPAPLAARLGPSLVKFFP